MSKQMRFFVRVWGLWICQVNSRFTIWKTVRMYWKVILHNIKGSFDNIKRKYQPWHVSNNHHFRDPHTRSWKKKAEKRPLSRCVFRACTLCRVWVSQCGRRMRKRRALAARPSVSRRRRQRVDARSAPLGSSVTRPAPRQGRSVSSYRKCHGCDGRGRRGRPPQRAAAVLRRNRVLTTGKPLERGLRPSRAAPRPPPRAPSPPLSTRALWRFPRLRPERAFCQTGANSFLFMCVCFVCGVLFFISNGEFSFFSLDYVRKWKIFHVVYNFVCNYDLFMKI